jgi:hypothetical protein
MVKMLRLKRCFSPNCRGFPFHQHRYIGEDYALLASAKMSVATSVGRRRKLRGGVQVSALSSLSVVSLRTGDNQTTDVAADSWPFAQYGAVIGSIFTYEDF